VGSEVNPKAFPVHDMKGGNVQLHLFLTSALGGGEQSNLLPGRPTPEIKAPVAT